MALSLIGTIKDHPMSHNIVHKNIRINATPERVWQALTDPEQTRKYFFHAGVYSSFTAGSPIAFRGRMFWIIPFEMKGVVLRAVPGRCLQYTLQNGHGASGNISTVTDTLTYENGQTLLSIADDVGDAPGAEKRLARSEKGWDKILAGLKKEVEG
ncbi:MAG: SRPBCC domain-containing protein [Bacteroidetes bacterium]|nr:SRPBCC domain-containing protein [Bacteroidota bacterium]